MSAAIIYCDYCGRNSQQVSYIMANPWPSPAPTKLLTHICDECVDECHRIFADRRRHPMADAMRQAWWRP